MQLGPDGRIIETQIAAERDVEIRISGDGNRVLVGADGIRLLELTLVDGAAILIDDERGLANSSNTGT